MEVMLSTRSARTTPSRTSDTLAPIPRTWLDLTMPFFRAFIGACFVAFSSYATVFLVAADIQPLVRDQISLGLLADRYWLGIGLALGFFLGELYTAERWERAYIAILIPDTIFTARQMWPGLALAARLLATDVISLGLVLLLIGGGVLLVAYGGGWSFARWLTGWLITGTIVLLVGSFAALDIAQLLLSCSMALYCGYIVARFGESLLFGKRRKAPS